MKEIDCGSTLFIIDSSEEGKVFYKEQGNVMTTMSIRYFNERGQQIKYISGNSSTGLDVWESVYDSAGQEIISYKFQSPTTETKMNLYDYIKKYNCAADLEKDSIIRQIMANKKIDLTLKYEYDKNGILVRKFMLDSIGLRSEDFYEHDKNNSCVKSVVCDRGERDKIKIHSYKYDERNNVLSHETHDDYGRPILEEYKYDSLNNVVEYRDSYKGKLKYKTIYYYEGRRNTLTVRYEPPGQLSTRGYSERDENGEVIKSTMLDFQQNVKRIWHYTRIYRKKASQKTTHSPRPV